MPSRSTALVIAVLVLAGPIGAAIAVTAGYAMPVHDPMRDLAVLGLVSIAEEIVFRGGVQPALARALRRRDALAGPLTASNLVTSVIFALAHLWRHPPLVALAVFPVSLVYGRVREASGRLWPAAALHLYWNVSLYAVSAALAAQAHR